MSSTPAQHHRLIILGSGPTGGLDRLAPMAFGTGTSVSGPATVEWFNPAPSPLLAHASREDGSFDLEMLLDRMEKSGIDHTAASGMSVLLAYQYQTLLLVDDPSYREEVLSYAHRLNEAIQEHATGIEGGWPTILARLERIAPGDTATLETRIGWADSREISRVRAKFLTSPGSPGVLSLADRMAAVRSYNAFASEAGSPLYPVARLAHLGDVEGGGWDPVRMVDRMRQSGVNINSAVLIMNEMEDALSFTDDLSAAAAQDGRNLDALASAHRAALQSNHTHDWILRANPRLDGGNEVSFGGLDVSLPGLPASVRERARLSKAMKDAQWDMLRASVQRGYSVPSSPEGLTMEQAKADLAQVAKAVGLRSLQLSMPLSVARAPYGRLPAAWSRLTGSLKRLPVGRDLCWDWAAVWTWPCARPVRPVQMGWCFTLAMDASR